MTPIRLAVLCDYLEEQWPSMDLCGERISASLAERHSDRLAVRKIVPPYYHRAARWSPFRQSGLFRNIDRIWNRHRAYPRTLAALRARDRFDLFHVVDHSYAQLVLSLPAERTVVTCHDLDTFRCLLDPEHEPRPAWFRWLAGRTLAGFRRAGAVVCDSEATHRAIRAHDLVPGDRLHVNPLGTHPECSPDPDPGADAEAARWLGPVSSATGPDLLHVGSTIPRKRIDVLLDVFAAVRRIEPKARLIKAGGSLNAEQERRARALGVAEAVVQVPFVPPAVLAALYRRAAVVLQPSEAEGFGLPVAEALACGASIIASDLPVLREVGGDAPLYRAVGDVPAWTEAVGLLLDIRRRRDETWHARRAAGLEQARRFHWSAHADRLAALYAKMAGIP